MPAERLPYPVILGCYIPGKTVSWSMKVSDESGTVIQLTQETEAPQREGVGVGKLPEAEHTGPEEMAVQAPESRPASAEVEVINSEENSRVALVELKKKGRRNLLKTRRRLRSILEQL